MNLKLKETIEIEIEKLLIEKKEMDINDPRIEQLWDKLTSILGKDLKSTLDFLNKASEEEIYLLSEVFEDIAQQLRNIDFIFCIEHLQVKFLNLDLLYDIEEAKKAMDM